MLDGQRHLILTSPVLKFALLRFPNSGLIQLADRMPDKRPMEWRPLESEPYEETLYLTRSVGERVLDTVIDASKKMASSNGSHSGGGMDFVLEERLSG